jgi:hypothetical protein
MQEPTISETMGREILKRIDLLQEMMTAQRNPEVKLKVPKYLDLPAFMEMTGIKETSARTYFKNKELQRRGILVKATTAEYKGGWLLNYDKWHKWANDNAKIALEV